jgi:hypothetical protein
LLFAVLISALVAITSASFVLLVQAITAQNHQALLERQRAVAELAKATGGVLNPKLVSEHFGMTYFEADRLMRGMVDDRYFTMKVDDRSAELVFWFTELVAEPNDCPRNISQTGHASEERASTRSSSA